MIKLRKLLTLTRKKMLISKPRICKGKPGLTKSDNPKSIAFNSELSSFEVYKKF
jgi:hypothetical protein